MATKANKVGNGTKNGIKRRRKGVHAKTKMGGKYATKSSSQTYRGQGR